MCMFLRLASGFSFHEDGEALDILLKEQKIDDMQNVVFGEYFARQKSRTRNIFSIYMGISPLVFVFNYCYYLP